MAHLELANGIGQSLRATGAWQKSDADFRQPEPSSVGGKDDITLHVGGSRMSVSVALMQGIRPAGSTHHQCDLEATSKLSGGEESVHVVEAVGPHDGHVSITHSHALNSSEDGFAHLSHALAKVFKVAMLPGRLSIELRNLLDVRSRY